MAGDVEGPTWVLRTAVTDRCASSRLVLVEAPGGWGKSTFAGQVVERSGAAACWVRPSGDTTLEALVDLVARGWRRAGVPDLADLMVNATDADDAGDQMLGALARRGETMVIVVDDAHRLDDAAVRWVRSVVDDLHGGHRAIVCAREMPAALARRLPAGTQVVGVGDLRFDVHDVARVLGTDDDVFAAAVLDRTDGWPTAVRLVAHGHALPTEGGMLDGLLSGLVAEVLGDDLEFVAPLAVLPRLSAAVSDAWASPGAFERLRSSGLPMTPLGDWWLLADPVREVLVHHLGDPRRADSARATAVASLYDVATAATFLSDVGMLDVLAEQLATRHWHQLDDLAPGQLSALLDALGGERRARWPRANLAVARSLELRDAARRRDLLAEALGVDGLDAATRHELQAEHLREASRQADMETVKAGVEVLLAELDDTELLARGRALLALGVAQAYASTPEALTEADSALAQAATIFGLAGERAWQADALRAHAIMVSYHGGRVALAAEQLGVAVALLTPGTRAWAVALTYFVEILLDLGRDAEAEAAAQSALDVGRRLGDTTVISFGAWEMACVSRNANDVAATKRWLDEVESTHGTWMQEVPGQEFLSFGADLMAALGDIETARSYRDRCAAMAETFGTHSMVDVVDGRLEAMYGDPVRAIEIFEHLDGEPYATIRSRWVRHLFRGLAAKRLGDRVAATTWVRSGIDLVTGMGLPDLPQRCEPVLVQMLADVWPGGPDAPVGVMRVALLGGFAVLDGAALATPAPGHPATLVKLLALRRTLTVEQAVDTLWPDADLTTGRQRLRNLLNRIRSQSGVLIEREAEALRLAPGTIVDVDQFDAAVDAVFSAAAHERPGLARLALGAYTGDLLPSDPYEDWAAAPRERLRRRYLGLVDLVAADAIERGDLDEAVRLLDLAIEREPLEEHRYVTIADALVALGRRSAARDVVQRAIEVLDDLGVQPGADLARVGRSLDVAM